MTPERLGLFRVGVEFLGELATDLRRGLVPLDLFAAQPRHAHDRAQLPGLCCYARGTASARSNALVPSRPGCADNCEIPRIFEPATARGFRPEGKQLVFAESALPESSGILDA